MSQTLVQLTGQVGTQVLTDGTQAIPRLDKGAAAVVQQLHGKYREQASRKKLFFAASQAATTWTIALAATHTGLCLSNPAGSAVKLSILQVGFALSVAPAGIAHIGLAGGWAAAGVVTHTTPLVAYSTYLDGLTSAVAKADAAATLVGTPVDIMPLMGGFTAGALPSTSMALIDIDGSVEVPAGGYVFIQALTVVIGFAGIIWEEIPTAL